MNTWQDKENNHCMAIVAGDGQIPVAHCRHIEDLEHDLGHPFPICLTQTSKGELEEHQRFSTGFEKWIEMLAEALEVVKKAWNGYGRSQVFWSLSFRPIPRSFGFRAASARRTARSFEE